MRTRVQHTAYKTGARGRGRVHADYIAGKGKNADKEDVIFLHDGNLPSWAKDAGDFFEAADEFERGDYKVKRKSKDGEEYQKIVKGRAYTEFEWSVPRGINNPVAWAKRLADETLGNDFVFRLAVHDAPASDGGRNINMHLMFCDRRLDGIERSRELFFKRAASPYRHRKTGQMVSPDPAMGGTQKDRFWNHKSRPGWARRLFERYVQQELPDFKLSKSKNPEPKIGPKVKKAGKEREEQRRAIEATVLEMRALRMALEAVDSDIAESQNAPHAAPPIGPVNTPRPSKRSIPSWTDFKHALQNVAERDLTIDDARLSAVLKVCEPRFAELIGLVVEHGKSVDELASLLMEQVANISSETTPDKHVPHSADVAMHAPEDVGRAAPNEAPEKQVFDNSPKDEKSDSRWAEFQHLLMEVGQKEFNVSWLLITQTLDAMELTFAATVAETEQRGQCLVELARLVATRLHAVELGFDPDLPNPTLEGDAELATPADDEPSGP